MALGDTVNYKVSSQDVDTLLKTLPIGAMAGVRHGRLPDTGEVRPATVVRDHGGNVVNLNVHIDANIGHWVASVGQAAARGSGRRSRDGPARQSRLARAGSVCRAGPRALGARLRAPQADHQRAEGRAGVLGLPRRG